MSVIVRRDCVGRDRMRRGMIGQALSLLVWVFPGHASVAITRKRHRDWSTRGISVGEGCVMAGQVCISGCWGGFAAHTLPSGRFSLVLVLLCLL